MNVFVSSNKEGLWQDLPHSSCNQCFLVKSVCVKCVWLYRKIPWQGTWFCTHNAWFWQPEVPEAQTDISAGSGPEQRWSLAQSFYQSFTRAMFQSHAWTIPDVLPVVMLWQPDQFLICARTAIKAFCGWRINSWTVPESGQVIHPGSWNIYCLHFKCKSYKYPARMSLYILAWVFSSTYGKKSDFVT